MSDKSYLEQRAFGGETGGEWREAGGQGWYRLWPQEGTALWASLGAAPRENSGNLLVPETDREQELLTDLGTRQGACSSCLWPGRGQRSREKALWTPMYSFGSGSEFPALATLPLTPSPFSQQFTQA